MKHRSIHIGVAEGAVHAIRELKAGSNGREVCGFLLGRRGESSMDVQTIRPAENIYEAKESFAISEKEYADALETCRGTAAQIVGIYHTHADSARPSEQDRRSIALSSLVWLIAGQSGDGQEEWRCFLQDGGTIREVPMTCEPTGIHAPAPAHPLRRCAS
jgi:proteasome lid subunit RPN8/RPN11